jgi:hypothetical protein
VRPILVEEPMYNIIVFGVSEWVSDCCLNAKSAIVQLYHGKNKLIFNEMMMRMALF